MGADAAGAAKVLLAEVPSQDNTMGVFYLATENPVNATHLLRESHRRSSGLKKAQRPFRRTRKIAGQRIAS
jgi:hypothetical protein